MIHITTVFLSLGFSACTPLPASCTPDLADWGLLFSFCFGFVFCIQAKLNSPLAIKPPSLRAHPDNRTLYSEGPTSMFRTFRPLEESGDVAFRWPHVTLLAVFFGRRWRTVALRSFGRHSLCANLRLSIGSAVLRYQAGLHDLCVTEGVFHPWGSQPQGEGLFLECLHKTCGIL